MMRALATPWGLPALRPGIGHPSALLHAFGDDLIGCLAVEHALAAAVVGSVEAARRLLELLMEPDADARHFAADATVEPLGHAVIRDIGLGVSCVW
jgi:hypothetical protein